MKHALVVGGTGMLADVSIWLIRRGYHVSVVARGADRMERLIEEARSERHITPLLVDYKNHNELRKKVSASISQNGAIDVVVAWIHSVAEDALHVIAKEVSAKGSEWELFHVLGSSANLAQIRRTVPDSTGYNYFQIQLGFVDEGAYSRWLTNEEISSGVIEAMKKKDHVSVVGQLEPWEKRP